MTACVNKKSKRVAAVVTASLVGALSIGAPAVALAGNISMLTGTAADAFSQGSVALANSSLGYTGLKAHVTVNSVTPVGGTPVSDVATNDDYRIYFVKADDKGNPTTTRTDAVEPGSYFVCVEAKGGDYKGGKAYGAFTVAGEELDNAKAFKADGKTEVTDSNLVYNANPVSLVFKIDGTKLVEGTDYTVAYGKKNSPATSETAPTNAGDYSAVLSGKGKYSTAKKTINFKINKPTLNAVTKDDFFVAPVSGDAAMPTAPTTVLGSEALAKKFVLNYDEATPGSDFKKYTVSAKLTDDVQKNESSNFTGDLTKVFGEIEVVKAKYAATINYNGAAMPSEMTFDASKNEGWSNSKVVAFYTEDGKKVKINVNDDDIKAYDKDGVDVTADAWAKKTPGVYKVVVTVVDSSTAKYAGTATCTVTLVDSSSVNATAYVKYDDKIVTEVSKTWDGAALNDISVTVKDADGFDVDSSRVTEVYKDAKGNKLAGESAIVDAGDYILDILVDGQPIKDGTVAIKVAKLNVSGIRIAKHGDTIVDKNGTTITVPTDWTNSLVGINGHYSLAYTGSNITPDFVYSDGTRDDNGDLVWKWFSGSKAEGYLNQILTFNGEEVTNVKKRGTYELTLSLTEAVDAKNMEVTAPAYSFDVDKTEKFSDVKEGAWYYEVVNKAADNGYIKGYAGTTLFGPEAQIKRGDVACVLFNMAGNKFGTTDNHIDEDGNFLTGFSDVNGHAYYAQAIAWAKQAGVVNGYGDGTFKPEAMVTREEFACMLANYAKLTGNYEAADSKVLDGFADKGSVSDWAVDSVAWAVEGEIMGNGGTLNGTGVITRAQVAAMAVNYQPTKLQ